MVAPHQLGIVIRSFVRVPGSGSGLDKKLHSSRLLDLGKMSSLAASVPASPLPSDLVQPKREARCGTENKNKNKEEEEEKGKKRKHSPANQEREREEQSPPLKRQCCETLRLENAELKRKLSLFQQLFKNEKRLASVVEYLQKKKKQVNNV